jgi:flagellar protein FlaF
MSNKNPYTQAADAYGNTAGVTDQRALEGKVLLKSARQLEELSKRLASGDNVPLEDIGHAVEYTRKLWMVFVNETMNDAHPLPQEIKNNIASLGVFVFKRSTDILVDTTPEKISALIEINRNIAAGLMRQPKAAESKAPETPPPATDPTDNLI